MKLTVLGNNGPFPAVGGACSGYLLSEGNVNILIDCGNGILSNLQRFVKFDELDAIILTHLHSDHMSDMMVLRYAIQIKMNKGQIKKPLAVYAPAEPAEEYARLNIPGVFNLIALNEGMVLNFENLKITFKGMKHPVKCFGVSVDNGNTRFVFSGDTAWTQNIIDFSRGADMVMLDAGLLARDKTNDDVPHLTARECGIVARDAEVKALLLTHFWPEYDMNELLSEAMENFQNVRLTKILDTYEI